jgi:hypothetical protein
MKFYYLNILVFCVIGLLEALFWHFADKQNMPRKKAKNLHIPLVAVRAIWFCFVWWKLDVASTVALGFCYPFFHLGIMYQVRHWLNPRVYTLGFVDYPSNTSTSIIDRLFPITFEIRLAMFIFGTVTFVLWNSF